MSKKSMKPVVAALGAAFAGSMLIAGSVNAAENPFGMTELSGGYMQIAEGKCGGAKPAEGKCGGSKPAEGKCGAGKCGASMKSESEGKCGASAKTESEGKCGAPKTSEGKCGAGKCGGSR